jgi:hypothetical protein
VSLALLKVLAIFHVMAGFLALPLALVLGLSLAPLLILGPLWLIMLGCLLWRRGDRVRALLRRTHIVAVILAVFLCAYGLFALRAADRSAAAGGGLLGAFGLLPLTLGAVLGVTSVVALWLARGGESRRR